MDFTAAGYQKFEEWWNTKDYPATCKGNCIEAFNAGYETMEAYNEKLLNGDIEKHNKIVELEADNKALKEKIHWWKKEVNVAHRAREDEFEKLVIDNKALKRNLNKAKEILREFVGWADWQSGGDCPSFKRIKDKAIEFLKEE